MIEAYESIPTGFLIVALLWEIFWKAIASWRSVKRNKKWWFLFIIAINSLGLIPIIYLVIHEREFLKKNISFAIPLKKD